MSDVVEVWADTGEVVVREATPEEIAQREADAAVAAAAEAARLQEEAAKEAARLSARARLSGMGFTDAEIDVMYPNLATPVAVQPLT